MDWLPDIVAEQPSFSYLQMGSRLSVVLSLSLVLPQPLYQLGAGPLAPTIPTKAFSSMSTRAKPDSNDSGMPVSPQ